jgi:hypothetical protein
VTHRLARIHFAVLATVLAGAPRAAEACAVCMGARDEQTRFAFLITTIFLSVLPLSLVGAVIWYLRKRFRELDSARAELDPVHP